MYQVRLREYVQISELTGIVSSAAAAGAASLEGVRSVLRITLPSAATGARTVLQAGAASGNFSFQPTAVAQRSVALISVVLSSGQVLQFSVPAAESTEPMRLVAESSLSALAQKQSDVPLVRLLDARVVGVATAGPQVSQSAVTKSSSTAEPAS